MGRVLVSYDHLSEPRPPCERSAADLFGTFTFRPCSDSLSNALRIGLVAWDRRIIVSGSAPNVDRNEHPPESSHWLEGLRRSDAAVVEALYARHFSTVARFVQRNSGTTRDAQDVFQEAMTALWLNAREGRIQAMPQDDLGAYLFRIARNKWLDVLRSSDHRHMRIAMDSERLDTPKRDRAIPTSRSAFPGCGPSTPAWTYAVARSWTSSTSRSWTWVPSPGNLAWTRAVSARSSTGA